MGYLLDTFHQTNRDTENTISAMCNGPGRSNLLDLGCGDGALTMRIAVEQSIRDVHGIELVAARAAEVRCF